jgi:phosphotransferase system HPr-like phosphotransfer protein
MNAEDKLVQELNKFQAEFKFKYVGGGYFRDMSVPKGVNADIKHGDEVISKFCEDFVKYLTEATKPGR